MTTPSPTPAELARIQAAATPRPWRELEKCDDARMDRACGITTDHVDQYGHIRGVVRSDAYDECGHPMSAADAELTCTAVNLLPVHLEQLAAQAARIAELEAGLVEMSRLGYAGIEMAENPAEERAWIDARRAELLTLADSGT